MTTTSIVQLKIDIKQRKILASLFQNNGQRFSELSKSYEPEDRFSYHIEHLLAQGFVNKRDGKYFITPDGVIKCSYLNFKTFEELHLKKTTINFICQYKDTFLIMPKTENKQGIQYVLPGDRAIFGEGLSELVEKLLDQKYGITGKITYRCTTNLIQQTSSGKVIFDDIVLIYDVKLNKPALKKKGTWLAKEAILKLDRRHPLIDTLVLDDNREPFHEILVEENFNFYDEDAK